MRFTDHLKVVSFLICLSGIAGLPNVVNAQKSTDLPKSEWVYRSNNGQLAYKKTIKGDRIVDFSHAGYMGGGVALPDVPVKLTVKPPTDAQVDCTNLIQEAIDKVSALPVDKNGFRGAVLLAPGKYPCSNSIRITADGVVLRGSGKSENGTVVVMS